MEQSCTRLQPWLQLDSLASHISTSLQHGQGMAVMAGTPKKRTAFIERKITVVAIITCDDGWLNNCSSWPPAESPCILEDSQIANTMYMGYIPLIIAAAYQLQIVAILGYHAGPLHLPPPRLVPA